MSRELTVGEVFGRLTILSLNHKLGTRARVHVRCVCGIEKLVTKSGLLAGSTQSCGCYRRELKAAECLTHGMAYSAEYSTWGTMLARCRNPNDQAYSYYGARGIKVCDDWLQFKNFYRDMGKKPIGHTLDRKNTDEDYSKDNCRWATIVEQNSNKRNSVRYEFNGKLFRVKELADLAGISAKTMNTRLARDGFSTSEAVLLPIGSRPAGPAAVKHQLYTSKLEPSLTSKETQ